MNDKWIFFDLDGTLIDTIPDLTRSINLALAKNNLNVEYENEKVLTFIGSGAKLLCQRATAPFNLSEKELTAFYNDYESIYSSSLYVASKPFPGVIDTLIELKKRGFRLGVFSNKPDSDTNEIIKHFFKDIFTVIRGHKEGFPIKPNIASYLDIKNAYPITDENVIYVGDMINDYEFSKNIGCPFFYCKYGYDIEKKVPYTTKELNEFKDILLLV